MVQKRIFHSKLNMLTSELLKQRPRNITFEAIEADTGIGVSWLHQYAIGNIKDPGVGRIETLYTYLAGKSIHF